MDKYELQWRLAIPGELIYPNQVHVWRTDLDLAKLEMERLLEFLSPDEIDRAGRYHFEINKNRYIAARGILRQILGGYLGKDPSELRFVYTKKGKPMLATNPDPNALCFNLSHSNTFALYAVTLQRNIGIDIEYIREDVAFDQIAWKFFSQGEISYLDRIQKNKVPEVFFQYWTRKESFLKGRGDGISFLMEKFDVSLINGKFLSPVTLPGEERESTRWFIQDLFPGSSYAAAIAVEGGNCDFTYLQYGCS